MEIIQAIMTKNPSYKRNRAIEPVGILVHSTSANNQFLKRYVDCPERLGENQYNNHWNKADATKSMHAFIGYDKNKEVIVAQTLPYDRACWGCGAGDKGSYNYDPAHLQFEICEGNDDNADYYWKAITVAEEYCAYLCKMFGWTADNITSHYEAHDAGYANNHGDPRSYMKHFGDSMDKFRKRVAERLGETWEPFENYQAYVKTKKGGGASIWKDNKKSARVKLLEDGTVVTVTGNADSKGFVPVEHDGKNGVFDIQYLVRGTKDEAVEKEESTAETAKYAAINTKFAAGLSLWDGYKKRKSLVKVKKGERVKVLSMTADHDFYLCEYNGVQGYADGQYLKFEEIESVISATINTKYDAGLSLWDGYKKRKALAKIKKGEKVSVLSMTTDHNFYYCEYNGVKGYIDGQYLKF